MALKHGIIYLFMYIYVILNLRKVHFHRYILMRAHERTFSFLRFHLMFEFFISKIAFRTNLQIPIFRKFNVDLIQPFLSIYYIHNA